LRQDPKRNDCKPAGLIGMGECEKLNGSHERRGKYSGDED
jgi:hypothetical protein